MRLLFIVIKYKDSAGKDGYKFNLINPIGWILLVVVCMLEGLISGIKSGWKYGSRVVMSSWEN
jgi:hypothetical protein